MTTAEETPIDYSTSHSGADWVIRTFRTPISPLGAKVANLLGWVFAGIYHIPLTRLRAVEWSNNCYIQIRLSNDWSTFDSDNLTALVVAAHDLALRVTLSPCNPHYLELMFHERQREGSIYARHPTIEDATQRIRARR